MIEKIIEIVKQAYREISDKEKIPLQEASLIQCCDYVTEKIVREMPDQSDIKLKVITKDCRDLPISVNHKFIIIEIEGKHFIIDPCWKQFLNEPDDSKPSILVSELKDLTTKLKRLGISQDKQKIWKVEDIQSDRDGLVC